MEKPSDLIGKRKSKIEDLRNKNINLFPNDFNVSHTVRDITKLIEASPDSLTDEGPVFVVAGRVMAINRFGKASFIRFKDRTGQLQAYIRKDKTGDEAYGLFKLIDIGDFVGLKGSMFKTKTGEWTLLAHELKLVCKSTRPLPEKFHGLRDPEKRYRRRYIDLIMNPDVQEIFIKRSKIVQAIRSFLLERDFLEVETPMMQPVPGGAEATPFVTHHNVLGMDLYLRIAPELYLKRLVVGGFERVFEINRNFRNEGVSARHNPEFTMLELYQAYATYEDLMDLTAEMFAYVSGVVSGSTAITYQGQTIDLGAKWRRMTLISALETYGGIDATLLKDKEKLLEIAASNGIKVTKTGRLGKIITKLFDILVEPKLIQPIFITGYPVEVSPLSRRNDKDPGLTDRFELFIAGHEIANGFSELNDPEDQKERFLQQMADREAGDLEAHTMDHDYIEALEYGMPPAAGEGIGIDRLIMLLTDSASIREVILFPHMKPEAGKGGS
ncbi:MAG: lysine--tRNA ligase [Pseudomonadota bacterium]|uniref:Lysine--tRNA ligase n=1 Tax=Candidatus Desulfatibia profunda TaxID=2841695 RepID=A0A8J6NNA3_9BACT|nr:lysine--tRNA ligase [Candidatus Desulfatibia profunda]MBL7180414.1 lysine--tRNA ligase [Desulfobacterales bacterium]